MLTRLFRVPVRNFDAVIPVCNVFRDGIRDEYRAVPSAGAANGDGDVGLSFLFELGQKKVDEGEDVMNETKEKDDSPADLALIGAGQRVEHYEIAAYTTARNLALQLRRPAIVQLLTMSLGEEQNAAQLLDQLAQPLMSVAKMPTSVE